MMDVPDTVSVESTSWGTPLDIPQGSTTMYFQSSCSR